MLLRRLAAVLVLSLTLAGPPPFFLDGVPPALRNPKLVARTVPLCFEAFAVLHSGTARGPLYAAERLTRAGVEAARRVERRDAFHEEDRLPAEDRADLSDYVRSGYDRGHLAPAGDMPTGEAQAQSFSLANIVPQDRTLNRNLWSSIEESVRRLALRRGDLFVVTGTVFSGGSVASIRARVLVPTALFKAVYDPARREGGAYLAPNSREGTWRAVSLDELRDLSGIEPFPSAPVAARARAMDLPEPFVSSREGRRREEESWSSWLGNELLKALKRALRDVLRSIF